MWNPSGRWPTVLVGLGQRGFPGPGTFALLGWVSLEARIDSGTLNIWILEPWLSVCRAGRVSYLRKAPCSFWACSTRGWVFSGNSPDMNPVALKWKSQRCSRGRQPHEVGPPMTLLEPPRSQVSSISFAGVETIPEDQAAEISVCPTARRAWGNYCVADALTVLEDTPLLWPWPLHRAGGRRKQVTLEIEQRWQGVLLWYIFQASSTLLAS